MEEIVLTGGEPTIRPDFFKLLELAAFTFKKVRLQTNARIFSSQDFARKTLEISPGLHFLIPFHHTNSGCFDSITRVRGSHSQTLQGIKNLLTFGAKDVCLKRVLLKQNYADSENFVRLAKDLGANRLDFTFVEGGGNARINWFKLAPRYFEIESYIKRALELANRLGIPVSCYDIPFCFLQGYERHVSETYNYVMPYLRHEFPKRIAGEKEDIITALVLARRKKAEQCKGCRFFKVCVGVWKEYLDSYGASEFKPVLGEPVDSLKRLNAAVGAFN